MVLGIALWQGLNGPASSLEVKRPAGCHVSSGDFVLAWRIHPVLWHGAFQGRPFPPALSVFHGALHTRGGLPVLRSGSRDARILSPCTQGLASFVNNLRRKAQRADRFPVAPPPTI
jgi:hypothetical protein